MFSALDNPNKIKKLDPQNMRGSIEGLYQQCEQTWHEVSKIKLPTGYRQVKNIVVNGMGSSALAAEIIKSLFKNKLKIPLEVINSYTLPDYLDKNSLYLLSSYSGDTEEPLATRYEALKRKAKILGITAGGKLALFLKQRKIPAFIFDPRFNPCNQPRMGLGYSILGQILLLKQVGLLQITQQEIQKTIQLLRLSDKKLNIKIETSKNVAKKTAKALYQKIPVIVAAEFLMGNAHIFQNQIHENAKNFATHFYISELNHHLMEGLGNPKTNPQNLVFLFLSSRLYPKRIKKRFEITKKVVRGNKIQIIDFCTTTKSKFSQVFEVLHFSSYVSFYLALLNKMNPTLIPWVDYFKKELA